ncbi:cell surface immobilization antigen (macronuclear) [Tetrahymena thermophila SB210]|uniref:Cell surface immobilization antigen n=1 Tax=Tetrahymena thermophila (strain SB210) TaxID=312017 RepID=I7M4E2_TETTS|nr:cell surface immobilization antigen [Tetrahymena thermophila SB210]EAS06311.2 cell surface immobilization antigen [Tetrahymena thermophila SB210]|eukprot:XP_001026556.2 cell surface immobilization antigen [Tetrahymena thermophila SB210]
MKLNFIAILFLAQSIFFVLADANATSVSCFTDNACNDVSCGRAGTKDNWKSTGTDAKCVVADCSNLNQGNQVSNNACASCYTNSNPPNIYSNNAGTACVTSNCLYLTFNRKMTTQDCVICVGIGSEVNPDNSTCTASTLTLKSSKLSYYSQLLLVSIIVIMFTI